MSKDQNKLVGIIDSAIEAAIQKNDVVFVKRGRMEQIRKSAQLSAEELLETEERAEEAEAALERSEADCAAMREILRQFMESWNGGDVQKAAMYAVIVAVEQALTDHPGDRLLDAATWHPVSELTDEDRLEPVIYARPKDKERWSVGIAYWTVSQKWNPEMGSTMYPAGFTYFRRLGDIPNRMDGNYSEIPNSSESG